jgi:hypothetical protein
MSFSWVIGFRSDGCHHEARFLDSLWMDESNTTQTIKVVMIDSHVQRKQLGREVKKIGC